MNKTKILLSSMPFIIGCLFLNAPSIANEDRDKASVLPEIAEVWRAYHDALKRKDADAAADLLYINEEARKEFRKYKDKLPKLAEDVAELASCKVYDKTFAMCTATRVEMVKGEKRTIGYPVNFVKITGVWQLEKP